MNQKYNFSKNYKHHLTQVQRNVKTLGGQRRDSSVKTHTESSPTNDGLKDVKPRLFSSPQHNYSSDERVCENDSILPPSSDTDDSKPRFFISPRNKGKRPCPKKPNGKRKFKPFFSSSPKKECKPQVSSPVSDTLNPSFPLSDSLLREIQDMSSLSWNSTLPGDSPGELTNDVSNNSSSVGSGSENANFENKLTKSNNVVRRRMSFFTKTKRKTPSWNFDCKENLVDIKLGSSECSCSQLVKREILSSSVVKEEKCDIHNQYFDSFNELNVHFKQEPLENQAVCSRIKTEGIPQDTLNSPTSVTELVIKQEPNDDPYPNQTHHSANSPAPDSLVSNSSVQNSSVKTLSVQNSSVQNSSVQNSSVKNLSVQNSSDSDSTVPSSVIPPPDSAISHLPGFTLDRPKLSTFIFRCFGSNFN